LLPVGRSITQISIASASAAGLVPCVLAGSLPADGLADSLCCSATPAHDATTKSSEAKATIFEIMFPSRATGRARLWRAACSSAADMSNVVVRRRRDGIVQILPPRGRRWDPHITSLVALVVGTALYVSTAIQWSLALVVVGVGCLLRELLHAFRARMLLRNPPAPVQELPPRWRRAC
jgi:hypothetical protein